MREMISTAAITKRFVLYAHVFGPILENRKLQKGFLVLKTQSDVSYSIIATAVGEMELGSTKSQLFL